MNVRMAAADNYATNNDTVSGNYVSSVQVCAGRARLFQLMLAVRTAAGANRVAWVFDEAAGVENASYGPKTFLPVGNGLNGSIDAPTGLVFHKGIFVVIAKDEPVDAATAAVTPMDVNDAALTVEYRRESE